MLYSILLQISVGGVGSIGYGNFLFEMRNEVALDTWQAGTLSTGRFSLSFMSAVCIAITSLD